MLAKWIFIILCVVLLLCLFTSPSEPFKVGCAYNKDCPCGKSCKCGPGCKCGKKIKENLTVLPNNDKSNNNNRNYNNCTKMTDRECKNVERVFKRVDKNATVLPGIGLPSQNDGVCTITHTMGPGSPKLKINGLESNSPLANNALFSAECAQGKYLNLYEMMLPEGLSSVPGDKSKVEKYAEQLNRSGINVAGSHWHWWASDPFVAAIHHQNVGMNPVNFAAKTTDALNDYKRM
jgi:hypothetical protein